MKKFNRLFIIFCIISSLFVTYDVSAMDKKKPAKKSEKLTGKKRKSPDKASKANKSGKDEKTAKFSLDNDEEQEENNGHDGGDCTCEDPTMLGKLTGLLGQLTQYNCLQQDNGNIAKYHGQDHSLHCGYYGLFHAVQHVLFHAPEALTGKNARMALNQKLGNAERLGLWETIVHQRRCTLDDDWNAEVYPRSINNLTSTDLDAIVRQDPDLKDASNNIVFFDSLTQIENIYYCGNGYDHITRYVNAYRSSGSIAVVVNIGNDRGDHDAVTHWIAWCLDHQDGKDADVVYDSLSGNLTQRHRECFGLLRTLFTQETPKRLKAKETIARNIEESIGAYKRSIPGTSEHFDNLISCIQTYFHLQEQNLDGKTESSSSHSSEKKKAVKKKHKKEDNLSIEQVPGQLSKIIAQQKKAKNMHTFYLKNFGTLLEMIDILSQNPDFYVAVAQTGRWYTTEDLERLSQERWKQAETIAQRAGISPDEFRIIAEYVARQEHVDCPDFVEQQFGSSQKTESTKPASKKKQKEDGEDEEEDDEEYQEDQEEEEQARPKKRKKSSPKQNEEEEEEEEAENQGEDGAAKQDCCIQ